MSDLIIDSDSKSDDRLIVRFAPLLRLFLTINVETLESLAWGTVTIFLTRVQQDSDSRPIVP